MKTVQVWVVPHASFRAQLFTNLIGSTRKSRKVPWSSLVNVRSVISLKKKLYKLRANFHEDY